MTQGDLPLIRTKLAPPRAGRSPVSRNTLVRALTQRRDRKLTLLVGPAGCGKTTALAQWRKQLFLEGADVAWYNVSPEDDDTLIGAYIVEALTQTGIEIDDEAVQLYIRSDGKAWKPLLAALVNGTEDHPREIYLVIDDFHYFASFGLLQLVDRWLALAPERFHLVLGTRVRPPLGLARLQAKDEITELRFGELRFDLEETRSFLQGQGLTQLTAQQVNALHEITDGWAAGLQLLAFSLRKQERAEEWFARQGGLSLSRQEALEAYLEKAVIEHLSEDELDFLTRVSACRRFNRELCELISGNPRAAEYLAKFENESLFLMPIDTTDTEPWYRFHRLFASYLNTRLDKYAESERLQLHKMASRWFAGKNLHAEAMRHAQAGGDSDFTVELIDRAARRMISSFNFVQFLKWCDSVPRERLRSRLTASLCAAWAQLSCTRIEDFDRNMADIVRHPNAKRPEVHVEVQLLKAYRTMRTDDTGTTFQIIEPMLQGPPPANLFHSLMLYNIASYSLVYADDFERARDITRLRHRHDLPLRPEYPKPFVDAVVGFSHLVEGNIRMAITGLAPYLEDALSTGIYGADVAGMFLGYLLEAYYQSGDIEQARGMLDRYGEHVEVIGVADGLLYAWRVRAHIQRIEGNAKAAAETLKRLEEAGYRLNLDRLIAWSLYEQMRLALAEGNVAEAADPQRRLLALAARHRAERHSARGEIVMVGALARAEWAYHQNEDAGGLADADAAIEAARERHRQLLVVRFGLMRALMLLRGGNAAEALAAARPLIRLAADLGMQRALPDFGAAALPLIEALRALPLARAEAEYLDAAQGIVNGAAAGAATAAATDKGRSSNLLSPREQEVLDLLAKALSIKSIARGLDLSTGTIKWHLKNVYSKLGALSREDALAKARVLGIL